MNWSVIITAIIVFVIFAGPFYLISRKSSKNHGIDETTVEPHEQEKMVIHPRGKILPKKG
jgi:hypothetical protein